MLDRDKAFWSEKVMDCIPNSIILHKDYKIYYANPIFLEVVGIKEKSEIVGRSIFEFLDYGFEELAKNCIKRIEEGVQKVSNVIKIIQNDGFPLNVRTNSSVIEYETEKYVLTILEDLTLQQSISNKLNDTFKELKDIKYAIDESSIVAFTDRNGYLTYVNDMFCEISQYTREELLGNTHFIINSGIHDNEFFKKMWKTVSSGKVWKGEICDKAKDGTLYWMDTVIVPFFNSNNEIYQYVSIRYDITARKTAEERAHFLAYHDELTGLPNKRYFDILLKQEVEKANISKKNFGLFFLDLDNFKKINDTMGHCLGDNVLIETAHKLQSIIGDMGVVSRRSGDEFTILIHQDSCKNDLKNISKQIINSLKEPFVLKGQEFYVTTSIGIAVYPFDGSEATTLLNHADSAMYESKNKGKNTYLFYDSEENSKRRENVFLESSLYKAIQEKQLFLEFQPQVNVETQEIIGAEALVRWNHPTKGIIYSDEFIPIAENNGFICELGEWVLKEACSQNKKWQQEGFLPIEISVNASVLQLEQEDFAEKVSKILNETGLEPEYLTIEITESVMQKSEESFEILRDLINLGVKIALDDFGKEYSSLMYLTRLPINKVKIDKSFIHDLHKNPSSMIVVKGVTTICKELHYEVIVEGVEDKFQLNCLNEIGCKIAQGYYFGKPMSKDNIAKLFFENIQLQYSY